MIIRRWLHFEVKCDLCGWVAPKAIRLDGKTRRQTIRRAFKQGWACEPWEGGASWTFCGFCSTWRAAEVREIIKGWKS